MRLVAWLLLASLIAGCGVRELRLDVQEDLPADDDDAADDDDTTAPSDDDDGTPFPDDDDATAPWPTVDEDFEVEPFAPCVDEGPGWTRLWAGHGTTCVSDGEGPPLCWGLETAGELGVPADVVGALSMGYQLSCGLRQDGTATCWGAVDEDLRPDGDFVQIETNGQSVCGVRVDGSLACVGSSALLDVPAGSFVDLGLGSSFACAVDVAGEVVCWGPQADPLELVPEGPFESLSVSTSFACAVRPLEAGGDVLCWELVDYFETPVVPAPPGPFTSVTTGQSFACGLRPDGAVRCWGQDTWGETHAPPGEFEALAAGSNHACGLRPGGVLSCWGRPYAAAILEPRGGGWSDVRMGVSEYGSPGVLCASTDERTFCEGSGWSLELDGVPSDLAPGVDQVSWIGEDGSIRCHGSPEDEACNVSWGEYLEIDVAGGYGCGLHIGGEIFCWGEPGPLPVGPPPPGPFVSITVGTSIACGLAADGVASCWGSVNPGDPEDGELFVQVAAGNRKACGLRADGTVACWGFQVASWPDPGGGFVEIAVGDVACGRRADDTVACWHGDLEGELLGPTLAGLDSLSSAGVLCGVAADGGAECWVPDTSATDPWDEPAPLRVRLPAPAPEQPQQSAPHRCGPVAPSASRFLYAPEEVTWTPALATGDFDGDGAEEVVVKVISEDEYLLLRLTPRRFDDGPGLLQAIPFGRSPLWWWQGELTTCDFNGDGRDDLVATQTSYDDQPGVVVAVYLGSEDGLALAPQHLVEYGNQLRGGDLVCADLDGDGLDDVVSTYGDSPGTLRMLPGTASTSAQWFTWVAELPAALVNDSLAAGDVNGDGIGDLLIGLEDVDGARFVVSYPGSPAGPASSSTPVVVDGVEGLRSLALGDLDGDGFDDLVLSLGDPYLPDEPGRLLWFQGSQDGVVADASWSWDADTPSAGLGSRLLADVDLDGDGYADLLVEGEGRRSSLEELVQARVEVFPGGPLGPADAPGSTVWGSGWAAFGGLDWQRGPRLAPAAADLDRDGLPDVLLLEPRHEGSLLGGGGLLVHRACPDGCP